MDQTNGQDQNIRNFRRLFEEGFSKGNVMVVDELISPDFREHMSMNNPSRDGVKELIKSLHITFPDFRCELQDVVAGGDKVWGRVKGGGTDRGGFMGRQPTGKSVVLDTSSIDICRFEGGKIAEHWGIVDSLGLMTRLGLIPPRGANTSESKQG